MGTGNRRRSREAALQLLYQVELSGDGLSAVLEEFWTSAPDLPADARTFAEVLARNALDSKDRIDALIDGASSNWNLKRLSKVDLNLLRVAVGEILEFPDTPVEVVINEAVEVARRFSNPEATSFVNGVLDTVVRRCGRAPKPTAAAAGVYDAAEVEARWQQRWADKGSGAVASGKPFYLLEMFPYPSGRIHMGHVRNYTIGDVTARFLAARGYQVLHPMGWDAFGLPAEMAAIERGIAPAGWTRDNIDTMRVQLSRMGFSYDWDRELATCDPAYYRWEQLFFLQMLEKGLAYRKTATVNWCDSCGTVLANEQVEGDRCWRGHQAVRQKELEQWFLAITKYADELLEGLEDI